MSVCYVYVLYVSVSIYTSDMSITYRTVKRHITFREVHYLKLPCMHRYVKVWEFKCSIKWVDVNSRRHCMYNTVTARTKNFIIIVVC